MADSNDDQTVRLFLAEKLVDPHIDGKIMVENLNQYWQWIKTGQLPSAIVTQLKVK